MRAQQISRAAGSAVQGNTWSVEGSGTRYMSLSAVRVNPSTELPSNQTPRARAASSPLAGMVTVFTVPRTSLNWR